MTDPDPRFGELSEAERSLVEAAGSGAWTDVRADADRQVRAGLLAELLTGGRGWPRAVKLRGARILGVLDLEAAELACPLLLADCHFDEPIVLSEATAPSVRLPGCHVPALMAAQLRTTGNLELNQGFTAERIHLTGADIGGTVDLSDAALPGLVADGLTVAQDLNCRNLTAQGETRLPGARVGGALTFDGATLTNPGGRALTADGFTVEQSMFCRDGFTVHGETHLRGAAINGTLDLDGAHLDAPGADAFAAARLTIGHDAFCRDLSVNGQVRLPGARIGGRLDLTRAHLTNPGGPALTADRLAVDDGVLAEGLTSEGEIRLPGAHIGGTLVLAGARLTNPGGRALNGDGLTIDQDLHASGFRAEGEVQLVRARIGGALNLDDAVLTHPDGQALSADALTVEQSAYCRRSSAEGEVRLIGAGIGGVADFSGARLANPGRCALYAVRLTVDGDLMCRRGFTAEGGLQLSGARVGGHIDLTDAVLTRPRHQALDLTAATAQALVLLLRQAPKGLINLTGTQVGAYEDDPRTWPATLLLRGFTYDTVAGEADLRARLRWTSRHRGGYTPQIYDQLAAAYRRTGHEEAARKVAIAKQWHRRKVLSPPGKLVDWLLYLTVGYGYRTWLAALWLAALLSLGTQLFDSDQMTRAGTTAPHFNALGYTLDVLLPLGDLGQQKAWQANGAALYWTWAFIASGWILSTAVVAGLTGLLKRN
ncbi:hypothetical protein [Actinomadura sp. BRA 177]|uniref:hypothetical protein n=1 Tax=Actinomadura sp. BRA 177 TaxID=2745202 RepID=UPI001596134D|nr:hypothetical protein [Actinomadura sp. BRA 177]NVI89578.1 hypothetical protein [Actinomadura sp. BRA 177]